MTSISIAGNLAADPEIRFTPGGVAVARTDRDREPAASYRRWSGVEGQRTQDAYRVQVWGSQAENCAKGDRVVVVGSIVTDRWADKESGESRTAQ